MSSQVNIQSLKDKGPSFENNNVLILERTERQMV